MPRMRATNSQSAEMEALGQKRLLVRLVRVNEVDDPGLLATYESLLSSEEQDQYRKFHFPADRHLYLVAHALLRTTLSMCAAVAPQDWQFVRQEHGRPELAGNLADGRRLSFNLAHTRGLAACVVAEDFPVGIDVEQTRRLPDWQGIAQRYFSRHEVRQLAALPENERHWRFFQLWTLKESYLKACGTGLYAPLDNFHFSQESPGRWQVAFDPHVDDSAEAWEFHCFDLLPEHILSVALRRGAVRGFQVDVRHCVPLIETSS